MDKLRIIYPVIVEGKYDKIRLCSIFEAHVVTTDGFAVFNKKEKLALIRALAKSSKIIVLTDSDGAGKLIRSHITGAIPKDRLIQLYIPRIEGKEKRKNAPSAEGTLGVEGMKNDLLKGLLLPYTTEGEPIESNPLSKTDLYIDGLTGAENSKEKRDALAVLLGLPEGMTPNALLEALKLICPYEKYLELVKRDEKN
jgi:ribonuclease M5